MGWIGIEYEETLVSLAAGSLVLPYVFLSPLAGRWAVTFKKIHVVRIAKAAKIPVMILASAGFLFHNIWLVMFSILLMGIQSSLFSPSKYGLIRDIGGTEHISYGTGNMEMVSLPGMILGTIMASFFALTVPAWGLSVLFLIIAAGGLICSLFLKAVETPPEENRETVHPFSCSREVLWASQHYLLYFLSIFESRIRNNGF